MPKLTMNPNSKASAVLGVLKEGPSTTGEVARELEWDVRLTSAHLSNLRRKGKVISERFNLPTGGRPGQLWKVAA